MNNETKTTKAILIDAENKTIKFVDIGDYKDILENGRFDTMTTAKIDRWNTLYVDDNGIANGIENGRQYGFTWNLFTPQGELFKKQDFYGNGIIGGITFWGEGADTTMTLEDMAKTITFWTK